MVNMATAQNSNNTLLISEILDKVHKAKTKARKIEILQQHDSDSLRMILKASFDPLKNGLYQQVKFHLHQMTHLKEQTIQSWQWKQESFGTLSKVLTMKQNKHKKKTCLYKSARVCVKQKQDY